MTALLQGEMKKKKKKKSEQFLDVRTCNKGFSGANINLKVVQGMLEIKPQCMKSGMRYLYMYIVAYPSTCRRQNQVVGNN